MYDELMKYQNDLSFSFCFTVKPFPFPNGKNYKFGRVDVYMSEMCVCLSVCVCVF